METSSFFANSKADKYTDNIPKSMNFLIPQKTPFSLHQMEKNVFSQNYNNIMKKAGLKYRYISACIFGNSWCLAISLPKHWSMIMGFRYLGLNQ